VLFLLSYFFFYSGEVRHLEGTEHLTIMELTHPLKPIDFSNQKQFEQEIGEFARALQPLHESQ
jgi:hypothetical protein